MSRITIHRLRAAIGLIAAAAVAVATEATDADALPATAASAGAVTHADTAAPQWSEPERLSTTWPLLGAGVLDDGTSVALELKQVSWTDSAGARHVGTELVEHRRPSGGHWSQRRVRRWAGIVGCNSVHGYPVPGAAGAEGSTVAFGIWCRANEPRRVRFARALVWTREDGWRGHDVPVATRLTLDQAPNGNVVFARGRRGTIWLLAFDQATGRWREIRKTRPLDTEESRVVVDNRGNLLLADLVNLDRGQRLVVQRRVRGDWKPRKVIDQVAHWLDLEAMDLNGRGQGILAWVKRTQDRYGFTTDVLKAAVSAPGGWKVEELARGFDELDYARAGLDRDGAVTVSWQRDPDETTASVLARNRSVGGVWSPSEELARDSQLKGFDVNPGGTAAVTYCPRRSSPGYPGVVVRVRPDDQNPWGEAQALDQQTSCAGSVAVGWDGTITAWWFRPEPAPSLPSLWSSTADAAAPPAA